MGRKQEEQRLTKRQLMRKRKKRRSGQRAGCIYESCVECTPSEDASESKKGKKINLSESIQRIWKKE